MSQHRYRPDIDGLRAIAIVPVVLFHSGLAAFSGGFVGVDVFFVISGFLITSLVAGELDSARFTLFGFWERRMRRIVPALLVIVTFSLIGGWFILLPKDFQNLSQSAFAQSIFSSNILFWKESGYFDGPSELKPLLHTWSLSVEEQFYLLFPPLLASLTLRARKHRMHVIAGGAIISLALSIWTVEHNPGMAFYLLPARGWELLLGAGLALANDRTKCPKLLREALGIGGTVLILLAVALYTPSTPFPGSAALLPCLGAALVIWSGKDCQTAMARILALRPVVGIGLISYSLYLWHWPLLAFLRYLSPLAPPSPVQFCVTLMLAVALAWASWRFVEMPFRTRRLLPSRPQLLCTMSASLIVLGCVGLQGYLRQGYPARIPKRALPYMHNLTNPSRARCHLEEDNDPYARTPCLFGASGDESKPVFLVFGDSHLDATAPVFDALAKKWHIRGLYLSYSGCPALIGVYRVDLPPSHRCREFNARMAGLAGSAGIKNIFLISKWSVYVQGWEQGAVAHKGTPYIGDAQLRSHSVSDAREVFNRSARATIAELTRFGAQVWIMEQVPQHLVSVADAIARLRNSGATTVVTRPLQEHLRRQKFVNEVFAELASTSVHILDPTPYFCAPASQCRTELEGKPLYKDDHHLTPFGAMQLRPLLEPLFARMAGAQMQAD